LTARWERVAEGAVEPEAKFVTVAVEPETAEPPEAASVGKPDLEAEVVEIAEDVADDEEAEEEVVEPVA
jgi:hypothetical protein